MMAFQPRTRTRPPAGGRVRCGGTARTRRPGSAVAACLVAVVAILSGPPTAASAVRIGGMLPGGVVVTKQVQSLRERAYAYLIEQQTDFSCGAAALATILRYGYDIERATEARVLKGLFRVADRDVVRRKGFSLLDIKHYVEAIGLRGRGYKVAPDTLNDIRVPTIVLLNLQGYRHFVVLREVRNGRAYVGDPALGNRVIKLEDFLDSWNGIVFAVIGAGYDSDTALMRGWPRVTARRLHDIYAPVPNAEAIGFGMRRAELF